MPGPAATYTVYGDHYWSTAPYYWSYHDGTSQHEATVPLDWIEGETSGPAALGPTTFSVGGYFDAQILPVSSRYEGHMVMEDAYATDSCHFDGSPYPLLNGYGNSDWPVNRIGIYGTDQVGVEGTDAAAMVNFYQNLVSSMGECGFMGLQAMSMDWFGVYDSGHSIGLWISAYSVRAYRGDAEIVVW